MEHKRGGQSEWGLLISIQSGKLMRSQSCAPSGKRSWPTPLHPTGLGIRVDLDGPLCPVAVAGWRARQRSHGGYLDETLVDAAALFRRRQVFTRGIQRTDPLLRVEIGPIGQASVSDLSWVVAAVGDLH